MPATEVVRPPEARSTPAVRACQARPAEDRSGGDRVLDRSRERMAREPEWRGQRRENEHVVVRPAGRARPTPPDLTEAVRPLLRVARPGPDARRERPR